MKNYLYCIYCDKLINIAGYNNSGYCQHCHVTFTSHAGRIDKVVFVRSVYELLIDIHEQTISINKIQPLSKMCQVPFRWVFPSDVLSVIHRILRLKSFL